MEWLKKKHVYEGFTCMYVHEPPVCRCIQKPEEKTPELQTVTYTGGLRNEFWSWATLQLSLTKKKKRNETVYVLWFLLGSQHGNTEEYKGRRLWLCNCIFLQCLYFQFLSVHRYSLRCACVCTCLHSHNISCFYYLFLDFKINVLVI